MLLLVTTVNDISVVAEWGFHSRWVLPQISSSVFDSLVL